MNIALWWKATAAPLGRDYHAAHALQILPGFAERDGLVVAASIGAIAAAMHVNYRTASRALDRLIDAGLVVKTSRRGLPPLWNLGTLGAEVNGANLGTLGAEVTSDDLGTLDAEPDGAEPRHDLGTSSAPRVQSYLGTTSAPRVPTKEKDLRRRRSAAAREPVSLGAILSAAAASPPNGGDGRSGLSQKHPAECRCDGQGVLIVTGDGPAYRVECPGEPF